MIKVNNEKCTNCALCAEVCPVGFISMADSGPAATGRLCIACGHCVAVCPAEALDNERNLLKNQIPLKKFPVIERETAEQFLRSRRSIRKYKNQLIPEAEIKKLVDIARFAPSGGNMQGLSYLVVSGKDQLSHISAIVIEWMKKEIEKNSPLSFYYKPTVQIFESGNKDIILRGAPHLIIALAKKDNGIATFSTCYSLGYVELYATSMGFGTCWAGFFDFCANSGHKPMMDLLQIPEDTKTTGSVMLGYPEFTFKRLVDRNPLDVRFI